MSRIPPSRGRCGTCGRRISARMAHGPACWRIHLRRRYPEHRASPQEVVARETKVRSGTREGLTAEILAFRLGVTERTIFRIRRRLRQAEAA